jgi:hypothetical protein
MAGFLASFTNAAGKEALVFHPNGLILPIPLQFPRYRY